MALNYIIDLINYIQYNLSKIDYIFYFYKHYLVDLHWGNLLKIFPRSNPKYMKENNQCKSLVIYGSNLESAVHLPKFTRIVSYMVNIPNNILYPLVGMILSDGHISYASLKNKDEINNNLYSNINSRFRFKQSIHHLEYALLVFRILSPYCISYPKIYKEKLKGKNFYCILVITRSLPCFTALRDLFYRGRIKIIPDNLYDLLTYEGLAHVIMGDGSFTSKGLTLNLQSFTLKELIFFRNVLEIKFNLDCTIHKSRNQYVVYIRVNSVKNLYPKIQKYIVLSMRYKFEQKYKIK